MTDILSTKTQDLHSHAAAGSASFAVISDAASFEQASHNAAAGSEKVSMAHTKHQEIPSLDGWRAVAIAIVIASHAGLGKIVPGGLGVTIFFFLSGYLITTLLVREFSANGSIHIQHFYLRRLLRLTPPLVLTLVLVYGLTYSGIFLGKATWTGFFSQLFYFANYFVLFFDGDHHVPYGTGVFWSLAVEEHFYFVFPALFLWMLGRADRRKIPLYLAIACGVFLLWRCYLVIGTGAGTDRTYFASDTRIDSILFGCILATIQLPEHVHQALQKSWVRIGAVSMGVILLLLTLAVRGEVFRETLRYTLQGVALIPLFYYSVKNPQSFPFRFLNNSWMRRVGIYSYSLYLSHFILLSNVEHLSRYTLVNVGIALLGSWIFAMLVDRFIDRPARVMRARLR